MENGKLPPELDGTLRDSHLDLYALDEQALVLLQLHTQLPDSRRKMVVIIQSTLQSLVPLVFAESKSKKIRKKWGI